VGVLGFSAGANLVGHLSWDRSARGYTQKEGLDDPRGPDFTVFIEAQLALFERTGRGLNPTAAEPIGA
jgi:hypothetical protein